MKHLSFLEFVALDFAIDRSVKSALRDSMPGYKPDAYDKAWDAIDHGIDGGVKLGIGLLFLLGIPVAIWFGLLSPLISSISATAPTAAQIQEHDRQMVQLEKDEKEWEKERAHTPSITIGSSHTAYLESAPWLIEVLMKGTVEDYNYLPDNAKEGDCWFVKARIQYCVFANSRWIVVRNIPRDN